MRKRGTLPVYLHRGIAKRPNRNKQPHPTPYLYMTPRLWGELIGTRMSVYDRLSFGFENWRFPM
ncbi:MAG: hypothetical protein IKL11_04940 [Muribaculaceae bacterium]|nr:hypothetical protein [Muribaculaceae bacterium]